jgi:hypothetical protein
MLPVNYLQLNRPTGIFLAKMALKIQFFGKKMFQNFSGFL